MQKSFKEPIRFVWIWVVLAIIVLAGVPWYLPTGGIFPIILGMPYWAVISVLSTVALSVFLNYVVTNCWDMEGLKEKID